MAIFLPAAYDPTEADDATPGAQDPPELWWAMKVYCWERLDDGTTRSRARVMPVPVNGSPDGPMFDLDEEGALLDPLFGPVGAALQRPRQPNAFFLDLTWLPPGWVVATRPGGHLDSLQRIDHPN